MDVKFGFSLWGVSMDRGCENIYIKREDEENYVMRSFIICMLYVMRLIKSRRRGWTVHAARSRELRHFVQRT
jgi:hypothetical protein